MSDFQELFLKMTSKGAVPTVTGWVQRHGLAATPMTTGLSLTGSRSAIEKAFGVSLDDLVPPASLPVPAELVDHVESIALPRPRSYHS